MKRLFLLSLVIVSLFALWACGGGTGSAPFSAGGMTYSGPASPAPVTAADANAIIGNLFFGASSGGASGGKAERAQSVNMGGPWIVAVTKDIAGQAGRIDIKSAPAGAKAAGGGGQIINGPCGGSADITLSSSGSTFSFSEVFNNFCSGGVVNGATNESIINGAASASGSFNNSTTPPEMQTMDFDTNGLSTTVISNSPSGPSYSYSSYMAGSIDYTFAYNPQGQMTSMSALENFLFKDTQGNIYWADNLTMLMAFKYSGSTLAETDLSMSGQFGDPAYGTVTVSTQTPFAFMSGNDYPSAGEMTITGANGAYAELFVPSPGNGEIRVYDSSGSLLWDSGPFPWSFGVWFGAPSGNPGAGGGPGGPSGQFVALTSDGIFNSASGAAWNLVNGSASGGGAYGDGKFAVTNSSGILTSTDGANWAKTYSFASSNASVTGPVFDSATGNFMALDKTASALLHSADGSAWTSTAYGGTLANGYFVSAAIGGGRFVVTGSTSGSATPYIETFNESGALVNSVQGTYMGESVTYEGGIFFVSGLGVAGGYDWSSDGNTWTSVAALTNTPVNPSFAYGNGVYLMGGTDSNNHCQVYTSTDGVNWTSAYTNNTFECTGAYFANGLFFMNSNVTGVVVSSDNGAFWDGASIAGSGYNYYNFIYGNGQYLATGWNNTSYFGSIFNSTDGTTWNDVHDTGGGSFGSSLSVIFH